MYNKNGKIGLIHIIVSVTCVFILLLPSQSVLAGPSVTFSSELDHSVVLAKEPQVVYLLVEFNVAKIKDDGNKERPLMNLGMVIDRSGSMSRQGKLVYAKKAAKQVVDLMSSKDRLAIVEYDDRVSVLWPSTHVEARQMIKRKIDALTPRGSTNLTGGMMEGVEQVQEHYDSEHINRILLLSDGLANQGITNPVEIKRLVSKAKRKGVTITTLGLGLQYNEDLMQTIAESGGGHYYFIEGPDQMAHIFRTEMNTLFTTVAKGSVITFRRAPIVKSVKVFGYPVTEKDRETSISMDNFYAEEKRSVLLRLEFEAGKEGKIDIGQLQLVYNDLQEKDKKTLTTDITLTASSSKEKVEKSKNKQVIVEAALIEADAEHQEYVRLYEKGRKTEAKQKISSLAGRLEELNKSNPDIKLAKKREALLMENTEMEEAERNAQARSSYLKKSKLRTQRAMKGSRTKYLLKEGDKGYDVERLQSALKLKNLYQGPVNGVYSDRVTKSVKAYQRKENLEEDGVAGPRTLKGLGIY